MRTFEQEVARVLQRRDGVATSSGTAALALALGALGICEGDEVLLPSYTCVALIHAVRSTGAVPVLAELEPESFNICPDDAKQRLTRRTRAIIVPHMFGRPADLRALLDLGVPVIEDCAQALGALFHGRPAGGFGVLTVCSFYATKVITTGEGGMVLSDSPALLDRVRDARDYDGRENLLPRFNYKMTDFQAALGLSQMRRLDAFVARRRELATAYSMRLASTRAVLPRETPDSRHIFYRYIVRSPHAASVAQALQNEGIQSPPPVFKPLHHLIGGGIFPRTDEAVASAVSLPIYPSLTDQQADYILTIAAEALEQDTQQWVPYSLASSAP